MSQPTSLWERLKHARVVQILAVHFGASWVVLQIADVLVDAHPVHRPANAKRVALSPSRFYAAAGGVLALGLIR